MLTFGLFSLFLSIQCADEMPQLSRQGHEMQSTQKALSQKQAQRKSELERIFDIPRHVTAPVMLLYSAPNLRIYGLRGATSMEITELRIWAFESNPIEILRIELRPQSEERWFQVKMQHGPAWKAPLAAHPALENFLIEEGEMRTVSKEEAKALKQQAQEFAQNRQSLQKEGGQETRGDWDEVLELMRNQVIEQEMEQSVEKNLAGPQFGGWLAENHDAEAMVQWVPRADGLRLVIYLHPKYSDWDGRFVYESLAQQLEVENRFRFDWLGSDPHIVEVASPSRHRDLWDRELIDRPEEAASWVENASDASLRRTLLVFSSEMKVSEELAGISQPVAYEDLFVHSSFRPR